MGFLQGGFSQLAANARFTPNCLGILDLGQSGWAASLLVVPGRGGGQPGQIRDNSAVPEIGPRNEPARGASHWPAPQEFAFVELVSRRRHRPLEKGKRCRSRAEIEKERRERFEKCQREIDAIVAEYHDRFPEALAKCIGAIYARYSSRFQDSIADQVRSLFEEAIRQGIFVPRENIFFDMAIRGCQNRRPGFSELQAATEARRFDILLVLSTSRLFRKQYKAMQFVEEEIVERGLHCLFKNWVDTRDEKQWRLKLQFAAAMDEAATGMNAENVRAAHISLLAKRRVYSTLSFGFRGEPIPGEFTKRGTPQRLIVICEEAAAYVKLIFRWFVDCLVPMDEIARRLNDDPNAPPPPKSITGLWEHRSVREVLEDERHRGQWDYGKDETKWLSKKDYSVKIPRDNPLASFRFEELRIISDEVWYAAQRILAEQPGKGRKPKDGDRRSRPRLLNKLFYCPNHDQPLYVGGTNGKTMFCKVCRCTAKAKRPLFTALNRKLALQRTCETLANLICGDKNLVQDIICACQLHVEELGRPDPLGLEQLKSAEAKLTKQIEFIMRNAGTTDDEQAEASAVLRDLRAQRVQGRAKIEAYEAIMNQKTEVPSESQVLALMDRWGGIFMKACLGDCEESIGEAREIVWRLTGGRIDLYQMGDATARRGWLQGRFKLRLLDVYVEELCGGQPAIGDRGVEVMIDYRKPRPSAEQAERAYELCQQGLLKAKIADMLEVSRSRLTKLLHDAYAARGEQMPDGRTRRSQLPVKHLKTPVYQQIADRSIALMQGKGFTDGKIGEKLGGHSAFVVGQAIRWWHESRGLPVPTSQERRLARAMLAKTLIDRGREMQSVAKELDCSTNTLRRLLDIAYLSQGQMRPDGRSRRHEGGGEGS